jgi:hypothetical protein
MKKEYNAPYFYIYEGFLMLITNKELASLVLFIKWQNETPKDKHKIQIF